MAKLKNTDKLVRRAVEHQLADEIVQQYYGAIKGENCDAHFRGCAIGCLSAPNSIQEIVADKRLSKFISVHGKSYFMTMVTNDGDSIWDSQREILKTDFGICKNLALLAEIVFENIDDESYKNWPTEFATMLTDGVKVTNKQIDKWCEDNGYRDDLRRADNGSPNTDHWDIAKIKAYIKEIASV